MCHRPGSSTLTAVMSASRNLRAGPLLSGEGFPDMHEPPEPAGNVAVDAASGRVLCELPIEGSQGWYVSAVFLPQGDELVMAELKVFPGPGASDVKRTKRRPGDWSGRSDALTGLPDGGVSARLLRCIRLTDLQHLVVATLAQRAEAKPRDSLVNARVGRPGSGGRSDRFYARWAFDYAKKLAEGSRSPIKDLAAERNMSQGQVRDLIHDARVRGLLSKERQGRAAGSLTDKAIRLLKDKT